MLPIAERRYEMLAGGAVVAVVVALALGGKLLRRLSPRPDAQQCQQLVDRYIDHASRQRQPDADARAIKRAIAASGTQPSRRQDVRACQQELSAEQVGCGLRAPNIDELERCLQ